MESFQAVLGLCLILALAWGLSEKRSQFPWRSALLALFLQFMLAWVMIAAPWAGAALLWLNGVVEALQAATQAGTSVVFGYLGGAALPFEESYPGAAFILAFQALPLILLISALSALLWYWRVLPVIVQAFAFLLTRPFRLGGAVGLGAAANIFVGMVEAPLLIRPVMERLSRSDLFLLMTTGMATIAGTVLVLYATILKDVLEHPVTHIVTASVISVPAAVLISRIMVPPEQDLTRDNGKPEGVDRDTAKLPRSDAAGAIDALTRGTLDGLNLLLSVVAMLIVMVALVALVDQLLGLLPDVGAGPLTLDRILGQIFRPYAWALGIPWDESATAGALIGKKTILNEFVAYLEFAKLPGEALSERSRIILLYALCGFANPASLGIMIGGLATMAPARRKEIAALAPRSLLSGTLATGMTGAIVGFFHL